MVVLVGSEKTVAAMTQNDSYQQRFTGLNQKLSAIKRMIEEDERG